MNSPGGPKLPPDPTTEPAARRSVAIWACALVALMALLVGLVLGRSSLFGYPDPEDVVGQATLANKANWLTVFKADDRDVSLAFDGSSVAWVDDEGVYWDEFSDKEPPCLRVNQPAQMEVSYVPLANGGGVVTQVRCLADG